MLEVATKIFGWLNVVLFALALANSVLRNINGKFIVKRLKNTDPFVVRFRNVMFFFIQNHRWFGIVTSISVFIHFALAILNDFLPPTGIILALLVFSQFGLGVYGFYIKQRTGIWQRTHRVNGYVILLVAIVHILLSITQGD